ncbi:MAG: hypothetical protein JWM56_1151 [Candidatus Peribacteria bacterium]|nr:hypothetical protein [Candidatus Peribacteria bacterium]
MKKWPTLEVNRDLLKASTLYFNALSNSKKSDEDKQSHAMNKFSDADIFIGATAIRYKSLLVTTNGSDFPRPIFDEIKSQVIGTEKIFILKPDTEYFESWIQKFMKEK